MEKKEFKNRIAEIEKFVVLGTIPRHLILIHTGDAFCWIQYYILQFLEKEALILIPKQQEESIKLTDVPKNFTVKYYSSSEELKELALAYMEERKLKVGG